MILDRTPLNMNEVQELLKGISESPKKEALEEFLKKFVKNYTKLRANLDRPKIK